MDYTNHKHQYLNELAREENMHPRTLRNKIRKAGFNESLRGLLPIEIIMKIQSLLHPSKHRLLKNKQSRQSNPAKAIQPKQSSQSNPAKAIQNKEKRGNKWKKEESRG